MHGSIQLLGDQGTCASYLLLLESESDVIIHYNSYDIPLQSTCIQLQGANSIIVEHTWNTSIIFSVMCKWNKSHCPIVSYKWYVKRGFYRKHIYQVQHGLA